MAETSRFCGIVVCAGVVGCSHPGVGSEARPALATYAAIAKATYDDTLGAAQDLDAAIAALVASPTEASLGAARDAWVAAREPYGQSEVFRFYGGPIEQGDPDHESALDSWPIDEAAIDYVRDPMGGILQGGLVNDTTATIDGPALRRRNGVPGAADITTGYHPIEFLLWGQDDPDRDGAGQRPATDYEVGTGTNADRRAHYLDVAGDLLIEDLLAVADAWVDETGGYRDGFVNGDPQQSLRNVFIGMGSLSVAELAGERIGAALGSGDQEDEQSCFSDNTHRDIVGDAVGIRSVYLGTYRRVDGTSVSGPSLSDLVRTRSPSLDDRLRQQLDASVAAAEAIVPPFDRAILSTEGRSALNALIAALRAQGTTIVEIARLFGIDWSLQPAG